MPPIITLLSDFGSADSYVGEVKGVLLSHVHGAALLDITHQVPPGDLRAGQYILGRVWHRFPQGTVHLAVVDPGVGTARRALAAGAGGHFFVAPDNGLLSCLPADAHFVSLPIPPSAAPTFHARDVFAPAAAQLAIGASLTQLGHAITDPYRSRCRRLVTTVRRSSAKCCTSIASGRSSPTFPATRWSRASASKSRERPSARWCARSA